MTSIGSASSTDLSKAALVIGGASCVWDDVLAVEKLIGERWPGIVVAVNDVLVHWPRHLDHACSLHPDKLMRCDPSHPARWSWVEQRRRNGFSMDFTTWGQKANTTQRRIYPWVGGSSGLLGVTVAVEICAPKIILCGIPMTQTPHFQESGCHDEYAKWEAADSHWKNWMLPSVLERMGGRVRSMSGRTKGLLGAPTAKWLACPAKGSRLS